MIAPMTAEAKCLGGTNMMNHCVVVSYLFCFKLMDVLLMLFKKKEGNRRCLTILNNEAVLSNILY